MSAYPPGFVPDSDEAPPPRRPLVSNTETPPAVVVHQNHSHTYHGITAKQIGLGCAGAAIALFVGVVLLLLVAAALHGPVGPNPKEGVKVGRELRPIVTGSLAAGFDEEAKLLEQGKSVSEANKALKEKDDAERQRGFAKIGGPFLEKIVPNGKEPETEAQRKKFVEAHKAIAEGLRDGDK